MEYLKEDVINLIDLFKYFMPLMIVLMVIREKVESDDKSYFFIMAGVLFYWLFVKVIVLIKRKMNVSKRENKANAKWIEKLVMIYQHDEEFDRYFLSDKNIRLAKTVRYLKRGSFVAFTLWYDFYDLINMGVTIAVYPLFIILMLAEFDAYLSGYTMEDYCDDIYRKKAEEVKKPQMVIISDSIIGELEKYRLASRSGRGSEAGHNGKQVQWDENDYEYSLLKGFLNHKKYDGRRLQYLVNPTVNILKKQNVIFNTYFYRDLDLAVFFPMMLTVFNGKKGLIVVEAENIGKEVEWVEDTFEEMCGIHKFIKCSRLEDAGEADDVIILNYRDLLNWGQSPLFKKIAAKIDMFFLVEPSLRTMQELNEINDMKAFISDIGGNPNIVIADSHQEIVDKIMVTADSKTIYKGPYVLKPDQFTVIWWDVDGDDGEEFGSSEIEVNIIRILKEKLEQGEIVWVNKERRPSVDLWWRFQKHLGELDGIILQHAADGRSLELSKEAYYIIEDDEYHYLNTAEKFLSRAEEKGFMCIMVPNYMMRNYMLKNRQISKSLRAFIADKIIAEPIESKNNAVIKLVKKMYEAPVKTHEIMKELFISVFDENEVKNELIDSIREYLDISSIELTEEKNYESKNDDGYMINENNEIDDFLYKESDMTIFESNKELKKWERINYHNVFQRYLPGQNIVLRGMRYAISYIGISNGRYIMRLRRSLENLGRREYYRQIRKYYLSELQKKEEDRAFGRKRYGHVAVKMKHASITCRTKGYIRSSKFNDLFHAEYTGLDQIPERTYKNRNVIEINLMKGDPGVQVYFAVILKEMLYTLCPENIDYLGIGINDYWEGHEKLRRYYIDTGIVWKVEEEAQNEPCVYLIDDSMQETGILQAIEKRMKLILDLMLSYMNWCIQSKEKYLLFGSDMDEEALFHYLMTVIDYLQREEPDYSDAADAASDAGDGHTASEEGEGQTGVQTNENESGHSLPMVSGSNGNKITSKEEARGIFAEVLRDMLYFKGLNINIPLYPSFYEKKEKQKKKGYVHLKLNVSRKDFYYACAYGIMQEYYDIMGIEGKEELFRQYANEYVDLLFTDPGSK